MSDTYGDKQYGWKSDADTISKLNDFLFCEKQIMFHYFLLHSSCKGIINGDEATAGMDTFASALVSFPKQFAF
jgi:hypothetical protein